MPGLKEAESPINARGAGSHRNSAACEDEQEQELLPILHHSVVFTSSGTHQENLSLFKALSPQNPSQRLTRTPLSGEHSSDSVLKVDSAVQNATTGWPNTSSS
jgi:hypothetical protein